MRKTIIIVIVICLLTGCKNIDKEVVNKKTRSLICTGLVEETNDNIEKITHKIILEFNDLEFTSGTMYMYFDLKDSSKLDEIEKVCKEEKYKSCETSIDNNRLTIKIKNPIFKVCLILDRIIPS